MKAKLISLIFLFVITLLGGFYRLSSLDISPPSLNWDEAALGYNAYSIMKTGKDEYGKSFPIFTRSFDEYKSTLPIYMMIPSIKLFGLNEVGVRFPSSLLGTLMIPAVYILAWLIFQKNIISVISAFSLAVSPWAIHLSQVNQESNTALFFMILGIILFLLSIKKHLLMPFSFVSLMLSMYSYNSQKVIVPLTFFIIIFLYKKNLLKYSNKTRLSSFIILLLFVIPFIWLTFKGQTFARLSTTNIFVLWKSEGQLTDISSGIGFLDFFLHGKFYSFLWDLTGRYLSYFSPTNLFLREPIEPVTILAGNSIMNPPEFIFWLIGIISFIPIIFKKKENLLFSSLILIAPIPAMFTWNWFQPGRTMLLFALYSVLVGFGVYSSLNYIKALISRFKPKLQFLSYSLIPVIFLVGFLSSIYVYESNLVYLPYRDFGNYQPGFRETVPFVAAIASNYDQVIYDTPQAQPYIFYLFYSHYPPEVYQRQIDLNKIGFPRKYSDFDNITFRRIYFPKDRLKHRLLLVGDQFSLPLSDVENASNAKVLQEVKDNSGNIMTRVVSLD